MADDNQNKQLPDEDSKKLDQSKTPALDAGDDTKQLKDSDDLALDALSKVTQKAREAVTEAADDEVAKSDELAETLMSLQNLIERNADKLDRIKNELKERRQSLRNVFENDRELQEAKEKSQEFSKTVRERKSKLKSDPQIVSLKTHIKELNNEKKEIQESLSGHLLTYYQLTNSTSIDTSDGDQWDFNIKAKFKRRR